MSKLTLTIALHNSTPFKVPEDNQDMGVRSLVRAQTPKNTPKTNRECSRIRPKIKRFRPCDTRTKTKKSASPARLQESQGWKYTKEVPAQIDP